jgi:hypothetical protein
MTVFVAMTCLKVKAFADKWNCTARLALAALSVDCAPQLLPAEAFHAGKNFVFVGLQHFVDDFAVAKKQDAVGI